VIAFFVNFAKLSNDFVTNHSYDMAKEIERKYLVKNSTFKALSTNRMTISQGYLSRNPDATVRVRLTDGRAFLTVKGRNNGPVRDEWEYGIPCEDARDMLHCCQGNVIEKTRHIVPYGGFVWEVDEFHGRHEGLVLAEIELPSPDAEFDIPPFVGEEVTGDDRYYNSNL